MNLPKQLINLIGAVLLLAIVAAGVLLVAVPAWTLAQTTEASADSVAQNNDIYDIEVQSLRAAQDDFGATEAAMTGLQSEIAPFPRLDDVYDIVVASAAESGATVQSLTATDPEAFVPRAAVTSTMPDADAAASTEEPAPDPAAAPEANTAEVGGDAAAPDDSTVEEVTAASPQKQVSITVEVQVADAAAAVAFMDGLGRGPRLLNVVNGSLDEGVLTVTAIAFIRTED